jgi:LytS/YehU family sensor histidine kinase
MILPPAIGGYRGLLGSLAETVISKVFSLAVMAGPPVALVLGVIAYRHIQAGKAYGMPWAISGILIASLDLLVKVLLIVALLGAHWPD